MSANQRKINLLNQYAKNKNIDKVIQKGDKASKLEKSVEEEKQVEEVKQEVKKSVLNNIDLGFKSYLVKGMLDTSKLVKKQIIAKKKDGSTYQTFRWVDNTIDAAHNFGGKYKGEKDIDGNSDEEKIQSIIENKKNVNRAQQHRDLMSMGIYDPNVHGDLLGDYKYATHLQKQELREHDFSGFKSVKPTGSSLPSDVPTDKDGKVDVMSEDFDINDIKEEVSQKDYDKINRFQKKKIAETLGVGYEDRWDAYDLCLDAIMITGRPKALIAYGTGGVGKTWELLKSLDRNNKRVYDEELHLDADEYDAVTITGSTSPSDMYNLMYTNKDKLVIFDDCDNMWDDEDAGNMLKGALDTSGTNTIRYPNPKPISITEDGKKVYPPKSFKFSGEVIFITNLRRKDLPQPIVNSRARAIDLSMTMDETIHKLNKIKNIMKFRDKEGNDMGVKPEHTQAVIDFLTKYRKNLDIDKVNGRTLSNLAMFAKVNERMNGGVLDKQKFEKQAAVLVDIA